jgi:hypothetical protein
MNRHTRVRPFGVWCEDRRGNGGTWLIDPNEEVRGRCEFATRTEAEVVAIEMRAFNRDCDYVVRKIDAEE